MRLIFAATLAAVMVATMTAADAQRRGGGAQATPEDAQRAEINARKKQADEKAYQDALKRIPASNEKPDPWKGAR